MKVARTAASESMDEQGLHQQCTADVDHAPTDAVPSPVPQRRWSTIPSLETNTLHPGCT